MAQLETADFFPPLGQIGGPGQPWPLSYGVDPLDFGAYRDRALARRESVGAGGVRRHELYYSFER